MMYQGDAAKYRIADRMREAERARLVNEARAARKHVKQDAPNRQWILGALAGWATWPFRHRTRLARSHPAPFLAPRRGAATS